VSAVVALPDVSVRRNASAPPPRDTSFMTVSPAPIVVLAAIIEKDGRFLLSRRLKGTHLEDLWEFPGGKCEPGETHEACLARELLEELGVMTTVGEEIYTTEHAYPERTVQLHFRRCTIDREPQPILGQEIRWVGRSDLVALEFPAADLELVRMLAHSRARS
jgi:mutator protein MutT